MDVLHVRAAPPQREALVLVEDSAAQAAACPGWASSGECVNNWLFMKEECGLSCGNCRKPKPKKAPAREAREEEAELETVEMDAETLEADESASVGDGVAGGGAAEAGGEPTTTSQAGDHDEL